MIARDEPAESTHAEPADDVANVLDRVRLFERLSTMGQLASHLAHQLGSPLNVIEGRAAMMATGQIPETDVQRNARIIGEQSARMVQSLKSVVGFVRRETLPSTDVDLAAVARTAASVSKTTPRARAARIQLDIDGTEAPVRGNADTLLLAVMHLVDNGLRASPSGGTVTVRLAPESISSSDDPEGPTRPFWRLDVEDQGSGIAPSVRGRLFQPFTTSRAVHEGTGMGLFLAQSIAKDHGGWIEGNDNDSGVGARFTLHLPRGQANAK